ncbi:putative uncharacterized protein DDB_G0282133 [Acyrthosiphon pisum]|uniref:Uncharacterized protein n=1 Tax=Acyrthosiphon pisum TaxID=7029 RepID=A0A8R2B5X0_ACYPI|nr:putative uncharacterized protein DDB_G0282133 [Acyrthosiphon pisum]|eukprot:XP_008183023.1 PREDICTED: GATA zinc finger domain-containing protein 15-like [Acyrthosiphon pisum]
MARQHSNSSKPNMNNNNKECGIKATEFNEILVMTPETELENPNEKMYKISIERSPWVAKYLKYLKFPLITKEIDQKTLGKSISQDTCLTVASDGIDFSRSDISTSNHQVNINEKISQFLDWNDSISKQKNEYYDILPNESLSRLPSGLAKNNHDSRDINDNIPWSNSNHVYWDENVKYYRYPLESSLSTIDIRSDHSKINDIPRIRSQPCLLDNYFTESNSSSKKQKNTLDTFWKEIGEIENSFGYSSDSDTKMIFKKNSNDYPSYNKYNSNKLTNINGKQSNINQEKNNLKWYKKDSSQNQFKNDHTLKTLNVEPHLNIENHSTSKCHVCDCPDSISKWQCIGDLKQSTENGKLTKSVNPITHRTDHNKQTQKIDNYSEKSKNDSETFCEQCRNCCHSNKKKLENDKAENALLSKRNKKLRELLGLKPEEKNVLVMLRL